MSGTSLDLSTSIVNLRRLADKFERGEPIALPPTIRPAAPAAPVAPAVPPAPAAPVASVLPAPPAQSVPAVESMAAEAQHVAEQVAEQATEPVVPPVDDLVRLEQVRAEVTELSGRRLSPWTRRRLEEAQAEEAAILDRLGFDSYLEVMLANATGSRQTEPGLVVPSSSRLPSLTAFAPVSLPSPNAVADGPGSRIDNGGNDDSPDGGPTHEMTWDSAVADWPAVASAAASAPRVDEAPAVEESVADEAADVADDVDAGAADDQVDDKLDDDGADGADDDVEASDSPATIADWLRTASFGGALAGTEVNVGA